MKKTYFGTDGIRGRVGTYPMTADFILKLGWSAGRVLAKEGKSKAIIGKDTRISGYMYESALEAGLSAAGVHVHLLGPMPTPGIAYLTRALHAQLGIVISASHNPYYDNGIKFFSAQGSKLSDDIELAIEAELLKTMQTVEPAVLGKAKRIHDAAGRYIEFCKSSIPLMTSLKGMKIVIDCANGATYHIAPSVLDELGAEVVSIGINPDGLNINQAVGSTDPSLLVNTVLEQKADLGIALDGDGDRVIMVDHKGNILDGDEILYIIAMDRLKNKKCIGGVVGTVMSNFGLEHALQTVGIDFIRTPVGDRYVLEMMDKKQYLLGGEASGHIICLDKTSTGDGIISALQVLFAMFQGNQSLFELTQGMDKFPQKMINVKLEKEIDPLQDKQVKEAVKEAENSLQSEGRVLLRASGTEPLIRVMVEGKDNIQVCSLAENIAKVVASICTE